MNDTTPTRRAAPESPDDFISALEKEASNSTAVLEDLSIVLVHGTAADRHPQYCLQAPTAKEAQQWIHSFNSTAGRRRRRSSAGPPRKSPFLGRPITPSSGRSSPGLAQFRDSPAVLTLRRPAAGAAASPRRHTKNTPPADIDAINAAHARELADMADHLSGALDSAETQWQRAEELQAALQDAAAQASAVHDHLLGIVAALGISPPPGGAKHRPSVDSQSSGEEGGTASREVAAVLQAAQQTAQYVLTQLQASPLAPLSALHTMASDAASDAALAALSAACDRSAMMRRFPLSASLAASPMLGLLSRNRRELVAPETLKLLSRVARQQNTAQSAHIPLSPLLLHQYKRDASATSHASAPTVAQLPFVSSSVGQVVHQGSADTFADPPRLTVTLATPALSTAARIELKRVRTDAAFESAAESSSGAGASQRPTAAAIAKKLGEAAADAFLERVAAATAAIDELPFHNGMQALRSFYALYAPEKIGSEAESLADFAGREEALFAMLERKYLRPVRVPYIPLSSMPTAPGLVLQPHWRPHHWQQWKSHVIVQETADRMLHAASAPHQGSLDPESVQRQLVSSSRGCGGGGAALASALASPQPVGCQQGSSEILLRIQEDERNAAFETHAARVPVETVCQGGRGQWLLQPALLRQPPEPSPAQGLSPDWVDEKEVHNCQMCSSAWSVSQRCHHCRACGRAVCSSCAPAVGYLVPPDARAHISHSTQTASGGRAHLPPSDRTMVWNTAERLDAVTVVPEGDPFSTGSGRGRTGGRPIPEFGYSKPVRVCLDCMKM